MKNFIQYKTANKRLKYKIIKFIPTTKIFAYLILEDASPHGLGLIDIPL